eukprot:TRINITY_DN7315_c0_g1_i1.p1 TRINITY_DN7315_c0_g1~~TRINITY_DN7315_c0_g1_i1.p1  ORF type:complete len:266 (+),score=92.38 TRINITY_DN7315_c0_g1_i1:84-881(+)
MAAKTVYISIDQFLADAENEVNENAKTIFKDSKADIQEKVMARGSLGSAKDKSAALLSRIRDAKYVTGAYEEDGKKMGKKERKDKKRALERQRKEEEGDAPPEPRKPAEIDLQFRNPNSNAKTELVSYLQTKLGRALKKDDVAYKTEKFDSGMWMCTVECACLDDAAASGEPSKDPRSAEQAAAKAFLEERRAEIEIMNQDARPLEVKDPLPEGEAKRARTGGKSGGKGKKGGWGGYAMVPIPMESMMPMMMMSMMMKGKGKGGW